MRKLLFLLVLSITITCTAQETKWNTWTKKYAGQKNYFPEYGNLPKSKDELKSDKAFIESITKLGYSKQEGSSQLATKGWTYLRQGDYENAMLRFNQSWLLDKTNTNALWGFGTIMGALENSDEAIKYLELAYNNDTNVSRLLIDISTAYLIRYNIKNDKKDLNSGLSSLLKYLKIDSKNDEALYKTAIFYFNLEDYNSSWTYLHKCYDQGGKSVQKGFVDALSAKMKDPEK
jgi:tetratricopeptide (TPR) repeat protein